MEKAGNVILEVINELLNTTVSEDIYLRVNKNLCSKEEFKLLFRQFTKGTFLERTNLQVEEFEPSVTCSCGYQEKYKGDKTYAKCPDCGKFANISNNHYEIVRPRPNN